MSAYEDASKIFRTNDPNESDFKEFCSAEYIKKALTDSNAVSQEAGCGMAIACFENCPTKEAQKYAVFSINPLFLGFETSV